MTENEGEKAVWSSKRSSTMALDKLALRSGERLQDGSYLLEVMPIAQFLADKGTHASPYT